MNIPLDLFVAYAAASLAALWYVALDNKRLRAQLRRGPKNGAIQPGSYATRARLVADYGYGDRVPVCYSKGRLEIDANRRMAIRFPLMQFTARADCVLYLEMDWGTPLLGREMWCECDLTLAPVCAEDDVSVTVSPRVSWQCRPDQP